MSPYTVKNKYTGVYSDIPCGKCPACKKRRVSGWAFRLQQEEKKSISSQFITLTYDSKNIPVSSSGYLSLDKYELPLFFKRLRKNIANTGSKDALPIKYFAVGEYGSKTKRPHYHALIFNAPIGALQKAWNKGQIHYGTVEGASIAYTLKYMLKKGITPGDAQKEFALMSKGLGESYLTKSMVAWHHADKNTRMYCNIEDGKKIGMPRYYKQKIYHEKQRQAIGSKVRQALVLSRQQKANTTDYRYDRNYHQAIKSEYRKMEISSRKNEVL